VTVIGGNLDGSFPKIDLLRDEQYLAENAAITADCALRLLAQHLPIPFRACPILIIGWGRIGKCLAAMLKNLDAEVTVAARKPSDLGLLTALGYKTAEIGSLDPERYRAIVNTAPAPVLSPGGNALKIDLASRLGMAGEDVIWARGLPGKMLPEASGALIARCVLRYLQEGEL
jgi:dipicolinate synthase subunit A